MKTKGFHGLTFHGIIRFESRLPRSTSTEVDSGKRAVAKENGVLTLRKSVWK